MRILFWTELFWPYVGGVEVRCRGLLGALRRRGHACAVVTSHGSLSLPDEDSVDGIGIRRFPFLETLATRRLDRFAAIHQRLTAFKKEFRPDIVHVHFTDPSILLHWSTQAAFPAPTVIGVDVALPAQGSGPDTLVRQTLSRADWTLAISRSMLDDVRLLAPEIESRSSVIYNSVEAPDTAPEPLPFNAPLLLCLGRVVRDKGFDVAIDALPEVRRRFPKARLAIAGDGDAKGELERQSRLLGVADAVDFLGWVSPDEVAGAINRAVMLLAPSRWKEAFGNVALQGMQMARPVVAADTGGLPEVVEDGVTGLVVPKEDPKALAAAIVRLLDNPAMAQRLGEAGRRRAAERFPFQRHVAEHEKLYESLLGRSEEES